MKAGQAMHRVCRFAPEYEPLRESFNGTLMQLCHVIRDLTKSADNVRNGATEILHAVDDLAIRNERQAGTVGETTAAMRDNSAGIHGDMVAGETRVEHMVLTMAEVAASSKDINQIMAVIAGLAFQTSLLALNAATSAPFAA